MLSSAAGGSRGRAMLMQKRGGGGAAPSRPRPLPSGPPPGGSAVGTPSGTPRLPTAAPLTPAAEGKQEDSLHDWDRAEEADEGKEADAPLSSPSEGKVSEDHPSTRSQASSHNAASEGKMEDTPAEGKTDDPPATVHTGGEVPMGRRAARPTYARPDAHTTVIGGGSTSPLPGLEAFEALRSPQTAGQNGGDDGGSDSEDSLLMEITDGSAPVRGGIGSSNPHLRSTMMDDAGSGSTTTRRRISGTALRRESDIPARQGAWGGAQPLPWGDHRRNGNSSRKDSRGHGDDVAEEDLDVSGDGTAVHATPGRARVLSDPDQLPQGRVDVPEMRSASPNDQSVALRRAMGPAAVANRTPVQAGTGVQSQSHTGQRHIVTPVRIAEGKDDDGDFALGGPQPVREHGRSRGPTPPLGQHSDEAEPSPSMARAYSDPADGNDPQGQPAGFAAHDQSMPKAYPQPAVTASGGGVGGATHGVGAERGDVHGQPPPPTDPLFEPAPQVVPIDLPPHTVLKGQAGALAGYSGSGGRQPFAIVDEGGNMVVKVPQGPGELELVHGKQLRRCVQKGWLRKRPEQGEWYKGWKRRYFRVVVHTEVVPIHAANAWGYSLDEKIQAAMLHYYEDEDPGTEAKATVPLIGCDADMVNNPAVLAKYPYCFQVTHPRRRTYFLDPCLPEGTPPEDAEAVSRNWVQIIRAGVETTSDLFVKRFKRQGQGPPPAAPPVAGMATAAAASPYRDAQGRMVGSPGFRPDPRSPLHGPQHPRAATPPRQVNGRAVHEAAPTSPHAAYGHFGQQVSRQ